VIVDHASATAKAGGVPPATLVDPGAHGSWPSSERGPAQLAPVLLAVAMEAAWIAVVAGLLQEFALKSPVIGFVPMAGFVAAGVLLARIGAARFPRRWPAIGTLAVFIAALAGVALSAAARSILAAGDPAGALAENPGGLLAGLAVLRGYPHAGDRLAVDTAARALFIGIPMLAIAAAVGGMVAEPWRSAFLRDAAIDSALFIVAGLLTLALAALADVRPGGAGDLHGNPVWMSLVAVAVVALIAFAAPIALAGGPSIALTIQVVLAGSIFPLAVLGLILGGRAALRRLAFLVGGTAFVVWILSFASQGASDPARTGTGSSGGSSVSPVIDPVGVVGLSGLSIAIAGILVFLLVRAWMRHQAPLPDDLADVRSPDLPAADPGSVPIRRQRRRPWSRAPRTASEAYLALVEDLHDVPDVRRKPEETPSEHARRIRLDQLATESGIGLELLAADYGLAEYGRRTISAAETRRAIGRWRSLRQRLRIRPEDAPARRSTIDDDMPPDLMKPQRSN
jgi:hypothetical protein